MKRKKKKELEIPDSVKFSKSSRELARIWAVDGKQVVVFDENLWSDPAAWGIFLADFSKHIANTYNLKTEYSSKDALERIAEGLNAELSFATSEV